MKKMIMLAASFAILAGACGKKDKVEEAATKVDNVAEKVVEKATDAKDMASEAAKETTEAYGSDSDHMKSKFSAADHELMMKSCIDEGKSKEICGCAMTAMNEGLSKETLGVLVQSTKVELADGAEAGQEYLTNNLNQSQQMEFFGIMPKLVECDPTILDSMEQ